MEAERPAEGGDRNPGEKKGPVSTRVVEVMERAVRERFRESNPQDGG